MSGLPSPGCGRVMVIVVSSGCQFNTHLMPRGEQGVVELVISGFAVEAFDKTVLHKLSWGDAGTIHLCLLSPVENGSAGERCSVFAHHHLRHSAFQHQLVEFSGHALP